MGAGSNLSPSSKRRKYKNPPILERIIEVQFVPAKKADFSEALARIDSAWLPDFPHKEEKRLLNYAFSVGAAGACHTHQSQHSLWRYFAPDRNYLIQAAPDLFAANDLSRAEPGWERLFPLFQERLRQYVGATNSRGITRCTLRYINEIAIAADRSIADYSLIAPSVVAKRPPGPLHVVVDLSRRETSVACTAILAFQNWTNDGEKRAKYHLHLIAEAVFAKAAMIEEAESWAVKAHDEVLSVFEGSLTQEARSLFGEIE